MIMNLAVHGSDRVDGRMVRSPPAASSLHLVVSDVMSRDVLTVTPEATFKQIERLLAEHHVNAVPVVDTDGRPVGIVSETDLVLKSEAGQTPPTGFGPRARHRRSKAAASTARGLITAPPVTVEPDARLAVAARLMRKHAVNQLLVVNRGHLIGIVSRSDLLKSFLRADEDIRNHVLQGVIVGTMWFNPAEFAVSVREGVVDISGVMERRSQVEILVDLIHGVDGVVDVRPALSFRLDDRTIAVSSGLPAY